MKATENRVKVGQGLLTVKGTFAWVGVYTVHYLLDASLERVKFPPKMLVQF